MSFSPSWFHLLKSLHCSRGQEKGAGGALVSKWLPSNPSSLFQGQRRFAYWERGKKAPLLMSPGVRMSHWPLLKGTFLPLRTPPGWPFFACSCLCVLPWDRSCLPRCTQSCHSSKCLPALPSYSPGRAAPGQGSEHPDLIQVDISFPHCSFLLELSFLETCHIQGMSKPAALNPQTSSDFLELARGELKPADRPIEKRTHNLPPEVLSWPTGGGNQGKRGCSSPCLRNWLTW